MLPEGRKSNLNQPKKIFSLSTEYGGDAGGLKTITSDWEKRIKSYEHYYQEEEKFGVNEDIRQKHQKKTPSVPVESFRQLEFD